MKKEKYNILIATGLVSSEHDPRVNEWLRTLLESCGRFKVKITEEFSGATAETLEKYDAVLINYDGHDNLGEPFISWGDTAEKALESFVRSGGGLIVYHSTVCAARSFSDEFPKMVGFKYGMDIGGRKSPKLDMVIKFTDESEITKGIAPSSWGTPCEDFFSNMIPVPGSNVKVLATVYDALEDYDRNKMQKHLLDWYEGIEFSEMANINQDHPVVWTNTYGEGRVFCVSIGHGPDTIRRPPFVALMCRGVEWACADEVTIDPPDLQYVNRRRTWPYYLNIDYRENARLMEF